MVTRDPQKEREYARVKQIYDDIQAGKAAHPDIAYKFNLIQQLPGADLERLLDQHIGKYRKDPRIAPLMMKMVLAILWHLLPDLLDLDKPQGPTH